MFWVSFQYVARKMYNVISEACKLLQDDLHSGTICFEPSGQASLATFSV